MNLFEMVIKELPIEIKTILYTILVSFNNTKSENAYFWNDNITSVQTPGMTFRFEEGSNINTLVVLTRLSSPTTRASSTCPGSPRRASVC